MQTGFEIGAPKLWIPSGGGWTQWLYSERWGQGGNVLIVDDAQRLGERLYLLI